MTTNRADAPWAHHDHEPTLEEIIRAKRPGPLHSVEDLMAHDVFESDEEVDEFVEAYRADRQASVG